MTDTEKNIILYLADFLSMQEQSTPVTDSCKYFFIKGAPFNIEYIVNGSIDMDFDNPYIKSALFTYRMLNNRFTEDDARDFVHNLCEIQASGMVDGYRMLQYIHQYDDKLKKKALKVYNNYINNTKYTHIVKDDDDEEVEKECTKYIAHADRLC